MATGRGLLPPPANRVRMLGYRQEDFDELVTEYMFGDILSNLAAELAGGMGMAPPADLSERRGVFQPSLGMASDIAGGGMANPIIAILPAAIVLVWLGSPGTRRGPLPSRGIRAKGSMG